MTKPLDIVLVGPGLIGAKHAATLQASADCRLSAVVAPDHPDNCQFSQRMGVPMHTDLRELLSGNRPDGVIIASPNAFHAEQAMACIEARVPVIVEKPITESVESGRALADAAKRTGSPVMVGHHRYHNPLMKAARELVQQGQLGDLVVVHGSTTFFKPGRYFEEGPWRAQAGGGPILINLIHDIGCLRYLCGNISAVHAFASRRTRGFAVEDSAAINLEFECGALGSFILSDTAVSTHSWEHTSGENPGFPRDPAQDCYRIAGTRGSLSVPSLTLYRYPGEASWLKPLEQTRISVEHRDPFDCQLEHFVRVIRGQEQPIVSAEEGLENLRVIEAIHQSAASGRMVRLQGLA